MCLMGVMLHHPSAIFVQYVFMRNAWHELAGCLTSNFLAQLLPRLQQLMSMRSEFAVMH